MTRYSIVSIVVVGAAAASAQVTVSGEASPGAVCDYRVWECEVNGSAFVLDVRQRTTVVSPAGDRFASLSLYENSDLHLKQVKAKVLDAGGATVYERDKSDLTKACGFGGYVLYQDVCTYFTDLVSAKYPYSVEISYTLQSNTLFHIPKAVLQDEIPVTQATCELTVPRGFAFRYKVYGLQLQPSVDSSGGRVTYSWQARDIPALEDVEYVPSGFNEPARVVVVAAASSVGGQTLRTDSWQSIGRWHEALWRSRYLDGDTPLDQGGDARAIIERIFNQLRSGVRYVAIEVGIGGWQPHEASQTERLGFGDCKDMSVLLISKLRNAGIEAYPAWLTTRSHPPTDTSFPQVDFNHVITVAAVNGDTVWMDPTCDECGLGDLPVGDEALNVLVGKVEGGVIRQTPASTASENSHVRSTRLHVDADRRLSFSTEMTVWGNYARYLRAEIPTMAADDLRIFVNDLFRGAEREYLIDTFEIGGLSVLEEPVRISVAGHFQKPGREIEGTIYVPPFFMRGLGGFENIDLDGRTLPIDLGYPNSRVDTVSVMWDSALSVDSVMVPDPQGLDEGFAALRLDATVSPGRADLVLSRVYNAYRIDLEQFSAFDEFRDRYGNACRASVKLRRDKHK